MAGVSPAAESPASENAPGEPDNAAWSAYIQAQVDNAINLQAQSAASKTAEALALLTTIVAGREKTGIITDRDKARAYPSYDGADRGAFLPWARKIALEVFDPNWDENTKIDTFMSKLKSAAKAAGQATLEEIAEEWRVENAPAELEQASSFRTPCKRLSYQVREGAVFSPTYSSFLKRLTTHLLGKAATSEFKGILEECRMTSTDLRAHTSTWEGRYEDFLSVGGQMYEENKVELYLGSLSAPLLKEITPLPQTYAQAVVQAQRAHDEQQRKSVMLQSRKGKEASTRAVVRNVLHLLQDQTQTGRTLTEDRLLAMVSPGNMLPDTTEVEQTTEKRVRTSYSYPASSEDGKGLRHLSDNFNMVEVFNKLNKQSRKAPTTEGDQEEEEEPLPKKRRTRQSTSINWVSKAEAEDVTAYEHQQLQNEVDFLRRSGTSALEAKMDHLLATVSHAQERVQKNTRDSPIRQHGCYSCKGQHNFYQCPTMCFFCKKNGASHDHPYGQCDAYRTYKCPHCQEVGKHFHTSCPKGRTNRPGRR
jgi:hypothetical protein